MPRGRDIPLLLLGIVGIGTSGPVIALSAMPILALIFWRNLGGALMMAPFAFLNREWGKKENRQGMRWAALAGIALAFHFIGFFVAMRFTTVAAGTALTALQPIFAAYLVKRLGGHIPRQAWIGMIISLSGVLIITGVDFQISRRAFIGDLAAIACAACCAICIARFTRSTFHFNLDLYLNLLFSLCADSFANCFDLTDSNLGI